MKNKKQSAEVVDTTEATSTEVTASTTVVKQIPEKRKPGRPPIEGSDRQKKMAERQLKLEANYGYIPAGRPSNPESARQLKLAGIAAKAKSGEPAKKGRPVMTEEAKAEAKAKREAAAAKAAELRAAAEANGGGESNSAE